jgi:hypothetical protein
LDNSSFSRQEGGDLISCPYPVAPATCADCPPNHRTVKGKGIIQIVQYNVVHGIPHIADKLILLVRVSHLVRLECVVGTNVQVFVTGISQGSLFIIERNAGIYVFFSVLPISDR